jgi:hypothetical protein
LFSNIHVIIKPLTRTYLTFPEAEKMKKKFSLSFDLAVLSMLMAACAPAAAECTDTIGCVGEIGEPVHIAYAMVTRNDATWASTAATG